MNKWYYPCVLNILKRRRITESKTIYMCVREDFCLEIFEEEFDSTVNRIISITFQSKYRLNDFK